MVFSITLIFQSFFNFLIRFGYLSVFRFLSFLLYWTVKSTTSQVFFHFVNWNYIWYFVRENVTHKILDDIKIRGSLNKFPDFFRMGTFIDSTHMELSFPFEVISSGCNALIILFQQLLKGTNEVLLFERVNDLRHSLFHLLNCLITTASELTE